MIIPHNLFGQFGDASSTKTIPDGLTGKARFTIHPQDCGDELFCQTSYGLVYLQGVFTLVNGHYAGHKVEQIIAIEFNEQAALCSHDQRQTMETWITMGRGMISKLLSSAQRFDIQDQHHVHHKATFDYQLLDGLECALMVGDGIYPPHREKNGSEVAFIFEPPHHLYDEAMREDKEIHAYPFHNPHKRYETRLLFRDDVMVIPCPQPYRWLSQHY